MALPSLFQTYGVYYRTECVAVGHDQFIPKKKSHTSLTLGKDGKQASWNLQMIGVRPEAQRRGVARQLIEFVYQNVGTDHLVVIEREA